MRIEARDIRWDAGGKSILKGVDIDLSPGGLTGLIGPNGAGKTTLLRILAGLIPPGAGRVLYDGRTDLPARERAKAIAYLAQGGEVNWALRADEIVSLGRLPHRGRGGLSGADRDAIERALAAADAHQFAGRIVSTLSGGERMRVLLARALAVEARFLLADEPVAALDPYHQLRAMEVLRGTADRGTGVVVVLHDLTLAHRFCDRLVLMHEGRVAADGAPDDVLSDARAHEIYGVGLLRGEAPDGRFVLPWTHRPNHTTEVP